MHKKEDKVTATTVAITKKVVTALKKDIVLTGHITPIALMDLIEVTVHTDLIALTGHTALVEATALTGRTDLAVATPTQLKEFGLPDVQKEFGLHHDMNMYVDLVELL